MAATPLRRTERDEKPGDVPTEPITAGIGAIGWLGMFVIALVAFLLVTSF